MTRKQTMELILRKLRSGNFWEIQDGEMMLMREAGVGPSGSCCCPNFPGERSRECFAHTFITHSIRWQDNHARAIADVAPMTCRDAPYDLLNQQERRAGSADAPTGTPEKK